MGVAKAGLACGAAHKPQLPRPTQGMGGSAWVPAVRPKPSRAHIQGICLFKLIHSAHFPFSLQLPFLLVFSIF